MSGGYSSSFTTTIASPRSPRHTMPHRSTPIHGVIRDRGPIPLASSSAIGLHCSSDAAQPGVRWTGWLLTADRIPTGGLRSITYAPTAKASTSIMRRVVVDSSVAVAWVLGDEPAHDRAVRFRDLISAGEIEPVVAGHFGFEVRSALMQAARRDRIAWNSVPHRVAAIDAMGLAPRPLTQDDDGLLEICRTLNSSWADAHWIDLAAALGLPLVTADERLGRRVPDSRALVAPLSGLEM